MVRYLMYQVLQNENVCYSKYFQAYILRVMEHRVGICFEAYHGWFGTCLRHGKVLQYILDTLVHGLRHVFGICYDKYLGDFGTFFRCWYMLEAYIGDVGTCLRHISEHVLGHG
jgi:hypothetical protein